MRTILSSRKKIAAAAVFVGLLTLMVFNNKFRMASWIGIAGTYTEPIFVNYFWDSGSGYNRFEESNLWLGQYADFENKTHSLEIGLVSQAQKLDQSQNVLLKGILLSRQKSQVGKKKLKDFHVIGRNIELKVGNPVKTVAEFSRITLSFVNGNGPAEIYIKVDTQIYKSRLPEPRMIAVLSVKKFVPGPAVNRLELPRIKLYGLKILLQKNDPTCRIEHIAFQNNARRNGSFMTKLIGSGNTITLDEKLLPNSRFHFLLFAIQVMTALFLAWLFHEWLSFIDRLPSRNLGAIFKFVFVDDSRWVFWGIFLSSCVFYFVWLLGLWPGEMNSDTFVMWQQTLTLELNNKFSFVYILILCALKQFYDTPAVAALFQLIVMSFLLAWIFWFAFKQGVPKGCLFFLYLLTLTSVPIAISTIFLNTTTFFALLAAFWGFYLFRLGFLKKMGKPPRFSNTGLLVLAILFYLLVSLRSHAIVYILFLPLLIFLLRIFPIRTFLRFMSYFTLIFLVCHFGLGKLLKIHERTEYRFRNMAFMIPTVIHFMANEHFYFSNEREQDKKSVQKVETIDRLLYDFYHGDFRRYFSRIKDRWLENEKEIDRLFLKEFSITFHFIKHIACKYLSAC